MGIGPYIRERRLEKGLTLRGFAQQLGVSPAYVSQVENEYETARSPSEEFLKRVADLLDEDIDVLLAMVGKVSSELQAVIVEHPQKYASLLRQLKGSSEETVSVVLETARQVRDGKW